MLKSEIKHNEVIYMIRGTTPAIQIKLPDDVSVADLESAVFSFAQRDTEIIKKTLAEMQIITEDNSLIVELSQAETLRFSDNTLVDMQLKIKRHGRIEATDIVKMPVHKIINDEVI